ncbi:anti-sigma factor antagonist [Butyrivibrio sp. AE3006]|uniref:anti-sigma factor antagonist n=1 Tax=Butyrivibrio sp. AE3006 TaxID=1280673 RepID=UPI00041E5E87|nr:anti-sigma factor antagonist [Butyrivibrio sp. AE3006]
MATDKMVLKLEGRIDSGNAHEWEEKLISLLKNSGGRKTVFDASDLEYISSAGLRVLMKIRKLIDDELTIIEVSPDVYSIFETTGFTELFNIKKKLRVISLDGCEKIGSGFYGTVYRIDQDTIVKMYDSPDAIPMIENEKKMAKMAFVKGIPTAISFDIVKSEDGRYGSVFELLKSKSFNDIVLEQPERLEEIEKKLAELAKMVHGTEMEPGVLPLARNTFLHYLDKIESYLDKETSDKCRGMLEALPDDLHVIHGDYHMKNVMISDDEPMLIDMDTLSTGQPIFDLQALFVSYRAYAEDEPGNTERFLGITQDMADHIWEHTIRYYFEDKNDNDISVIMEKVKLLAYIRFLGMVTSGVAKREDLTAIRIEHTVAHIKELAAKYDDFDLAL